MTEEQLVEILKAAKKFFIDEIIPAHIQKSLKGSSKLSSYNVNPFLIKYLANVIAGDDTPKSVAKALLYPRILGTSINTIFGMRVQKMISVLFKGLGSSTSGIDIEFVDALDGRKKYCQVKAGPNTINHDDIKTVKDHFKAVKNLARTNGLDLRVTDLVVGVIYGNHDNLSGHYLSIEDDYPLFIGADFWHRLTGHIDFYNRLTEAIAEAALEVDAKGLVEDALDKLAKDIEANL